MSPVRKKKDAPSLFVDPIPTNQEASSSMTSFKFPSDEVRRSLGINADFSIDWIEIRRNNCYIRGIRLGYSNGIVSPLMGGEIAEKCKITRIDGLGGQEISRVEFNIIDN